MFHLFKRVYLTFSELRDQPGLGIILSSQKQAPSLKNLLDSKSLLEYSTSINELLGADKKYPQEIDFFEPLMHHNRPVVIYADVESFNHLFVLWLKLILKKPDPLAVYNFYKATLFKFKFLHEASYDVPLNVSDDYLLSEEEFKDLFSKTKVTSSEAQITNFVHAYASYLSVEFLLASYLSEQSYKEELKKSITPLLKKDLEKYFYELKEIIIVHLLHRPFTRQFKLDREVNFSNFEEIINSNDPALKVLFDERIWRYQGMRTQTSGSNVNFENITPDDIHHLKAYSLKAGCAWSEESCYQFTKSDVNKLEFIKCFRDFSDEDLNKLIEVEASFINAAGSFFSIDLQTVNHYLIHHLLDAWKNNDHSFLTAYSLRSP